MPIATIAIDLAKSVFEVAAADENGRIVERRRLTRGQLVRYFQNHRDVHIVMEACGTAHYWARQFAQHDMRVSLLPPHYVRAYVRRNKPDSADATALLEAVRATDISPVTVKSVEQQALQGLHRLRAAWCATRTARINTLRGLCREFGIVAPVGAKRGLLALRRALAQEGAVVPAFMRATMERVLEELQAYSRRAYSRSEAPARCHRARVEYLPATPDDPRYWTGLPPPPWPAPWAISALFRSPRPLCFLARTHTARAFLRDNPSFGLDQQTR